MINTNDSEAATKPQTDNTPSANESLKDNIISWAKSIAIAVAAALFVTQFLIFNAVVPTGSMIPTVMEGDRVIGWRPVYAFSDPQRGDIVIFKSFEQSDQLYGKNLVKRVIGLPNDRISIVDGVVFVNDQPLAEDYVHCDWTFQMDDVIVPHGCYFVMGDNRDSSFDSRYWDNPFVNREDILAKVLFSYYPSPRIVK